MEYILGIDVGTASVKVGLFDFEGRIISTAQRSLNFLQGKQENNGSKFFEQDPYAWLKAIEEAVKECVGRSSLLKERIIGFGIGATSATVIFCDAAGKPLYPAIMWMDNRAEKEAKEITKTRDNSLLTTNGIEPAEYFWPKVFWMQENRPEIFERTIKIVDAVDWLIFHLTGRFAFSYVNAVVKAHYSKNRWPGFISEAVKKRLPSEVIPYQNASGYLLPHWVKRLGLPYDLPIVSGGIDGYAAMVGLELKQGEVGVSMGNSWSQFLLSDQEVLGREIWGPFVGTILPKIFIYETGQIVCGQLIADFCRYFFVSDLTELTESALQVKRMPKFNILWGNRQPTEIDFQKEAMVFYPAFSLQEIFAAILNQIVDGCVINIKHLVSAVLKEKEREQVKIRVCGGGLNDITCKILEMKAGLPVIRAKDSFILAAKGTALTAKAAIIKELPISKI